VRTLCAVAAVLASARATEVNTKAGDRVRMGYLQGGIRSIPTLIPPQDTRCRAP
jgi:hypothetical protein